ncbi:oligosaccharide flippase family protein [Bacillus sp. FJAT-45066]|uniref:oligosaccharide flippase family protein n=1 Tax=Bacillus sp. FJAT-45066 TaxID=2011010 RepID=UPI000BB95614|nr:oligosaccharide flippase family protein [Bacillus sp. FJAT-45066]
MKVNQLKAGAILSYLSLFITTIITLLYTPIIIRLLGQAEFGLYSMIGSIAAYLSIMDLGLGNAIVRYTSRNRAIGDKEAESRLNGMFLLLYSFIGVTTLLVGIMLFRSMDEIFGASLTASELEMAKIMIIILIINFSLSFPLSIFGSIMQAYERFIAVKIVTIIRSLLIPIITIPFLLLGYGSISMVLITTLVSISCLLFNVYYCYKHLKINFYFGKFNYKLLREILGYSFFIFLGILVDQINLNMGQVILGALSGTFAVAVFAIAIQFIRLYLQFSTSISGLFLPRVTMMVANKASNEDLTNMMIKFGRVQYIIVAYILSGFILFGHPFISIWAGANYSNAYYMALIILVPITIPLIQNIGLSILQAKNKQGFRSIILIIIAVLNVIISIPLAKIYGGIGVALGAAISYIIGNGIIMNIYYHRKIGINILLFWNHILILSIPVVISLVFGYAINFFVVAHDDILFMIFKIGMFSSAYFLLMWFFGINKYEKNLVISFVKTIKNYTVKIQN